MQQSYVIIFAAGAVACVLAWLPERYRPAWLRRLKPWQMVIGVVAVLMALLIVLNPEFLALGILGDSAFFDLLVLAIGLQLQTVLARGWNAVAGWCARVGRRTYLRWCFGACCVAVLVSTSVAAVQKAVQRLLG